MGNIRVTFSDDNSDGIPETKSINDYYSFGMEWNNRWELSDTISPVNKYRYNGKEFVEEMGWKNLDYGLRNMDPLLGRMMQVDPLAGKYPGMSPFQYAGNNPIAFIDIKGDSISPFARAIVGDDSQGHITSATTEHRENAPISAGLKDASFFIFSSLGLNALDNLIFGSEPLEERVVNAANEIVTPVPSKMPKVGKLSGVSTLEPGPYAKESIKTNSTSQKFNKSQRQEINRIGNETGCHTCGSTDPGTKSGNFVPDHQPIGVLNPNNKSFDLFPHCINCSKSQGGTVSQIVKNQKSGKK